VTRRSLPRATRLANIAAKRPRTAARISAKSDSGKQQVLKIGSKAFNRMFPQLGALMGGVYRGGESGQTPDRPSVTQMSDNLYGQILENQNKQNDILNQILRQIKTSNNNFAGPTLLNNNQNNDSSNNNRGGGGGSSNNNSNNSSIFDNLLNILGLGAAGYSAWGLIKKLSRSGPTVIPPTNIPRPPAPPVPTARPATPASTPPRPATPSVPARPAAPASAPPRPATPSVPARPAAPASAPPRPATSGNIPPRPATPASSPPRPATPAAPIRPASPPGTATTIPRPIDSPSISQRIAQASTIEELRAIQNREFERLGTTQRQALENVRSVERAGVIQRQTSQQVDQLQRLVSRRAEQLIPPTVSAVPSPGVSIIPERGIPTPNVGTSSLPPLSSSSAPTPRIPPTVTAVPPPAAIPRIPGPINLVPPPPPPAAGPVTPVARQRISTISESRVPRSTPYRSIRLGQTALRILGSIGLRVLGIASGVFLVHDVYVGLVELKARTVSISVRNRQTFFTTLNNLMGRIEAYNNLLDQLDNETDPTKIQDLENTIKEENAEISSQYDRIVQMAENLDKEYNEDVTRRLRNGQNIPENQRQAPYLNILANTGASGAQQQPDVQNKDENDGSGGDEENGGSGSDATLVNNDQNDGSGSDGESGGSGGDATPVNKDSVNAKQVENIPAPRQRQNNSSPTSDTTSQILQTLRTRESSNNYLAQNRSSSASGAYQFIDSTWRGVTRQFGIGTEYRRAIDAPPAIQDAVAAAYVNSILASNNNDISVVPLVWFTGNARGYMSPEALAVNRGLTGAQYQANWMRTFQRQHGGIPLPQNVQRSSTPQGSGIAQGGSEPSTMQSSTPQTGTSLSQAGTNMISRDQQQIRRFQEIINNITGVLGQQTQMNSELSNNTARGGSGGGTLSKEIPLRTRFESAFGFKNIY
jgi:hypothetical protein